MLFRSLIESHERRAKEKAGLSGRRRGQEAAARDAEGAAMGSIGLAAFAAVFYVAVPVSTIGPFAAAVAAWTAASMSAWWLRRKRRTISHRHGPNALRDQRGAAASSRSIRKLYISAAA